MTPKKMRGSAASAIEAYIAEYDCYQVMFSMFRIAGWSGDIGSAPVELIEQLKKMQTAFDALYREVRKKERPNYKQWAERLRAESIVESNMVKPH